MSDPRVNPRPDLITERSEMRVARPLVDLLREPDGPRDRQLLYGDEVTVLSKADSWSYLQARKDGYCGFVPSDALGPEEPATHQVCAPATHLYQAANLKSPDRTSLSFGSRLSVTAEMDGFAETAGGFVPLQHLKLMEHLETDPAAVAQLFLGTPYLWGGNSRFGIDCSGLVQAALLACGIRCPGDSDLQMALGAPTEGAFERNDLLFWKGHVALVMDGAHLIHATAHSMSCLIEPIAEVMERIEKTEGPLLAHRRL